MTYQTWRVTVDGEWLAYLRGPTFEHVKSEAEGRWGSLTGLYFHPVDVLSLVLDLIRDGCNTRQKIKDETRLDDVDIQSVYNKLKAMRMVKSYDGVWGEYRQ